MRLVRVVKAKAVVKRCVALVLMCGCVILSYPALGVGNLTLAWDPSPDSNVVYKVYYGPASGVYTNSVAAGSATTVTVSNLMDAALYYFAATAVDTNGLESEFSNEASGMVNPPNQLPTLNAISDRTINEDSGLQSVSLSGISSGSSNELQTLVVTATSSNPALIPNPVVNYVSPGSTGSLSFTAVANAFGSATITVRVNDGGLSNNITSRSFVVTVNGVNDSPTLNALANLSINENAVLQTVGLSGISSGATNEIQVLTVTATSSNPGLIPAPVIIYTSPSASGSLTFTPVPSAWGTATITVRVSDGVTNISRQFTVTVNHLNQSPTISAIARRTIAVSTSTGPISFTISDAETPASSLTLSARSDNQVVVPDANVVFGGSSNNRTVTVTPTAGQIGLANIVITVSDGSATASTTFQLTVKLKPAAPGRLRVASSP